MELRLVTGLLVGTIALLHVAFLVLEMFYWDHPLGRRIFRLDAEFSAKSRTLAANQGLYNGFLASGLLWGLFAVKGDVIAFFLGCVVVAGIYGGITVKRTIFYTQGLPAIVTLALLLYSR